MVYGPDCPGNYAALRKAALALGRAPKLANERSMLFIGNLCRYVEACLIEGVGGMRIPQDPEYVNTAHMMRLILQGNGREAKESRFLGAGARAAAFMPAVKKAFGALTADRALTDIGVELELLSLEEAMELTEKDGVKP